MTLSQDLQHSFEVRSSLANVWSFFWDIQALARCLSGCENVVAQVEGKSYRASIRRKVAVFSIGFDVDIEVIETQPPCSVTLRISGQDKRLRTTMQQQLVARLQAINPQVTRVDITTTIHLSGLLASLGKNLVSMQFTQVLDDFAANVGAAIEARASQAVASEPQETKSEEG
jgi:carbon monoxide dehydrogenase subunit G